MPGDYTLFVHSEDVALYRTLRRQDREPLDSFFDFLERYPTLEGESSERDADGRRIEVKFIRGFRVVYWANHASKEVKILRLERIRR